MPYTTPDKVKMIACAGADDLKKSEEDFDALLTILISWATAEINAYTGRAYTDAELAADANLATLLESVCVRAVDNWLMTTVQRMTSPIVTINDFTVRYPSRTILTRDMKDSLKEYVVSSSKSLAIPAYTESVARFSNEVSGLFEEVGNP